MIYLLKDNNFDNLAWQGMEQANLKKLFSYLKDNDYRVRTLASQAIQIKYSTKKSFHFLIKMLHSFNHIEREIGAYTLGQLGTPKMHFAKETLPFLYKLLNDKNEEVLVATISAIGHLWSYTSDLENKKIIKKIINFTKHKNSDIKISSLITLSSIKFNKKIKNIIKNILIQDKNEEVKEWAEVALEILNEN